MSQRPYITYVVTDPPVLRPHQCDVPESHRPSPLPSVDDTRPRFPPVRRVQKRIVPDDPSLLPHPKRHTVKILFGPGDLLHPRFPPVHRVQNHALRAHDPPLVLRDEAETEQVREHAAVLLLPVSGDRLRPAEWEHRAQGMQKHKDQSSGASRIHRRSSPFRSRSVSLAKTQRPQRHIE